MNFTTERDALMKELDRVTGVIEARNTIPILSHIRIDAGAGGLLLRATNLEMEAESPCAADVAAQGVVAVPGKVLSDFVKRCPAGSQIGAMLDSKTGRLKLACGRARSVLPALPPEDFPDMERPSGPEARVFLMDAPALKAMIERTRFAVSTDETRHYLRGVYFHQDGESLVAAATNGHMLSRASLALPAQADGMADAILPRRFLGELARLLPSEGELSLEISSTRVAVTLGEFRLVSLLIDATFPDYRRVIPQPVKTHALFDRAALIQAVQRVAIVASADHTAIQLTLAPHEIRVAAQAERGTCFDAIDADVTGEVQIGMNYRYLLDILGAFDCARICLHFEGPSAPMKFTTAEEPDSADCMVLMPMRVEAINQEKEAA